jgi:hypothetical protein
MSVNSIDIVRELLDNQLVDSDDVPCGKIADIEFSTNAEGTPCIAALLVGIGPDLQRLPRLLQTIGEKLFGRRVARINWQDVATVQNRIMLKGTARHYDLDEQRTLAYRIISRIPVSWKSNG